MKMPSKKDLAATWNKTKTAIINGSVFVVDKTKEHVKTNIEQSKIQKQIKHFEELAEYRTIVSSAKKIIKDERIKNFVDDLDESPYELFDKSAKKIKQSFPIPVEQTIIWAHVIKDTNRVGGIVVTECGVFIKTVVNVFEEKALKKENRKASELFYCPWETFGSDFCLNNNIFSDYSMLYGGIRSFADACNRYEDTKYNARIKTSNYYNDQIIGGDSVAISGSMLKGATKFNRDYGYGNDPQAGFGLFAEQANNRADLMQFKNAKVVGGDNVKNGPDRLVNGVRIQTKYYSTGRRSINATFENGGTGNYRYYNHDGTPMKLEVPKGQYDSAVKTFKNKIRDGKVPGVTDPNEAERIIVEGHYTYEQAVRISKAGTIESLVYDLQTGAVSTTCVFGISFLINSYLCYRKTRDYKEAAIEGLIAGGKAGALAMSTHVLVSQLSRTKTFSKIMTKQSIKSGAVSAVAGFVVFSIPETYNYAVKKISGAQYASNLVVLSASIIGGTAGAVAGTAAGTSIGAPAAGGVVGGLVGGTAAGVTTSKVIDVFFEGDDKRIARLFNAISINMMSEYLLDKTEIDEFVNAMNTVSNRKFNNLFKSIHQSKEQVKTIRDFLEPYFDEIIFKREKFLTLDLINGGF